MSEASGDEYCRNAESKLTSWSFFSSRREKVEEASDLYIKAANQYKIVKKWTKAGKAYQRAAELSLEVSHGKYTAASNYVNAAQCLSKDDPAAGMASYQDAVKLFLEEGKLHTAAKHMQTIAEMSEEAGKITDALIAYQKAADYYEAEGGSATASTKCLLKVAYMSAEARELEKAVEILEKVALSCVGNNLLKFKVKDYCVEAGICRIGIGDLVACKKSLDQYAIWQPEIVTSPEFNFLEALVIACENYDGEKFSDAVTEYAGRKNLLKWQTSILLEVKEKLDGEEEGAGDLT